MDQDLPKVDSVLKIHRKIRALKAKIKEEKIKAKLWALGVLTKEQRNKLRKSCGPRGPKGRFMKRGKRGGRGMGRGPGGPGPR